MTIVKFINERPLQVGGDQHTGWLPAGAATPLDIAFRRFREETQAAMDERRTAEVVELFQMADRVLACAFPNMRSLFHVVYVEDLRFDEWSWASLTPRLKAEFQRSIAWTPDRSKRYR